MKKVFHHEGYSIHQHDYNHDREGMNIQISPWPNSFGTRKEWPIDKMNNIPEIQNSGYFKHVLSQLHSAALKVDDWYPPPAISGSGINSPIRFYWYEPRKDRKRERSLEINFIPHSLRLECAKKWNLIERKLWQSEFNNISALSHWVLLIARVCFVSGLIYLFNAPTLYGVFIALFCAILMAISMSIFKKITFLLDDVEVESIEESKFRESALSLAKTCSNERWARDILVSYYQRSATETIKTLSNLVDSKNKLLESDNTLAGLDTSS